MYVRITTRKVRQVLLSILVGALIGGGLMWLGIARANADGSLTTMEQMDGDRYHSIYCNVLDQYPNEIGAMAIARSIMSDGFDADSSVDVLNYTVSTYCPEHWQLLVNIGNKYRTGAYS